MKVATVQRLLKLAVLTTEQIAEATDLPVSTIESIQKDMNKDN
ncbi:hypothetical protein [Tunicatimonas pelagia]|nr:hypothetical protein [Tunicatimonas pelagia]WKN45529.1 hypothetical protein P0M28_11230 [Tunicatimonas pelagia]